MYYTPYIIHCLLDDNTIIAGKGHDIAGAFHKNIQKLREYVNIHNEYSNGRMYIYT